jgi:benzoate membrane transport protein
VTIRLARTLRGIAADVDRDNIANGFFAWLFAATAALAVLLAAAQQGGLADDVVASWIFAGYGIGGLLTLLLTLIYRQPLGMGWSIPAAALVGPAFGHLAFGDVVGAYLAAGLLITVLGLTGRVSVLVNAVPGPVMMGMVAGVFLPFGVKVVQGFEQMPWPTAAMVLAYILVPRLPVVGARTPPILGALVAGTIAAVASLKVAGPPVAFALADPIVFRPTFSWSAMVELVLPLAITVLGIHNPQGFAVLRQAGHAPPVDAVTIACGLASLPIGLLGCGPACMTGPANAITVASGAPRRHYVGALVFGLGMLLVGLFAPVAVGLAAILPGAFIGVLGGLALLPVLRNTFAAAFGGRRFGFGALIAFMTATSNISLLHVGAAFWALVFGTVASLVFEREDFRSAADETTRCA